MFTTPLLEDRFKDWTGDTHAKTSSAIITLASDDVDHVAGAAQPTQQQYNQMAAYWAAVAACGGLAGQPEIVFAAGMMSAYDWFMGS